MKTITDSIFNGDDCFILKDSGSELSMENAFLVKGWGIFLCREGHCRLNLNTAVFDIGPNCEILVFPDAKVRFSDCSEDLSMTIFSCTDEMMSQALRKISADFFSHIRRYPVYRHVDGSESDTLAYFEVLRNIYCDRLNKYRRVIATNILRCLMLNVYDKILRTPLRDGMPVEICRSQEIYGRFRKLLQDNVKERHDVSFYAETLCITGRYLASVTSAVSGRPPKEEIDECLLREARILLTFSELSVQQISDKLHFPDPSHFGRFFKRMTGITPLAYRKTGMVM
ncbi:MAG: helix-turn-helix domain-containing protein [Candidatus Cryptobacteroides sp.]